jgi:hypothetical protein
MSSLRKVTPPNLPIAPPTYSRGYLEQLTNILRLFFVSITNEVNSPRPHGSFYSTATQTNPVASTTNLMTFTDTVSRFNTGLGAVTSRIYVVETAVYDIQFSAQLDKTSGSAADIYIWLRVNGQDVPYSSSKVAIQGTAAETIAAWNFMVVLQANDYIELAWASSDTHVVLLANTAVAPSPEIPSVILTIQAVSQVDGFTTG